MEKIITIFLFFFVFIMKIEATPIMKELKYDRYTLPLEYNYSEEIRTFQIEKMSMKLQNLEYFQQEKKDYEKQFGILKNYKNSSGTSPRALNSAKDPHGVERDPFGNIRYQGIPMYLSVVDEIPMRYALDGELILILGVELERVKVKFLELSGEWYIPIKYVRALIGVEEFKKVIFIDRKNQNIATMDKEESEWKIRSMNPVTTGVDKPPHFFITPLGNFVLQEKLEKMLYLKDGSNEEIEGFAPYASRFTGGVYVHGIPINYPKKENIEYAEYLGTYPRTHKCIRSATSHARFIYNWGRSYQTIVFVIE